MTTIKTELNADEKLPDAFHMKQSLRSWLRLLSCSTMIEKAVKARLKTEFCTTLPRFDVLAALERTDAGMTMSELSAHLLVSNGNVTGIVQRLVEDGFVVKAVTENDRRTQRVMLTRKGQNRFAKMTTAHERWIDAMFNDLPPANLRKLYDGLGELKASIVKNETKRRDR